MSHKKAVVIGFPIKHSLSPVLHGYWLKKYGIDGSYEKVEVLPDELGTFYIHMKERGLSGGNVTVPYKENTIQYMDRITEVAEHVGAVNTVVVGDDGEVVGDNTDVYGFIENIKAHAEGWSFTEKTALVLGAGGAAKAVVAGLLAEGVSRVVITNRTLANAQEIAERFGGKVDVIEWDDKEEVLPEVDFLVNTTVLGMVGKPPLEINLLHLPAHALVTDIVYTPLLTPLLKQAKQDGYQIVDGLGMLLYQAVPGFEAWFGKRPEVTPELRQAILQAIA